MEFRSEYEILRELLDDAVSRGLLTETEEITEQVLSGKGTQNQYVLILSVIAALGAYMENLLSDVYSRLNILTMRGDTLDNIGLLVGVPRITATQSRIPLTLSLPVEESSDITIPAGTRIIIPNLVSNDEYVIESDTTLHAGVTSVNTIAVCLKYGQTDIIPANTVSGIDGYPTLIVSNEENVNGRNIEEDADYRQRILRWNEAALVGTKQCISNYLSSQSNINDFHLVPRYDGVGTLKIVVDAPSSELMSIGEAVYENCMLVTDYPPLVVRPGSQLLSSISMSVHIVNQTGYTEDEIKQLIVQQTNVFISGGYSREGVQRRGLGICEDFVPSQLIAYLLGMVPEVDNIVLSSNDVVVVDQGKKLVVESVVVSVL